MKPLTLALMAASMLTATPALADETDLKAEIALLKQQLSLQAEQIKHLEAETDALAAAAKAPAPASPAVIQTPPAAAPSESPAQVAEAEPAKDTTIGGYGEVAYNAYLHDSSRNQADLKRFVLFVGHSFNDRLSFNSEVEWEHAVTSAEDRGESEIEQAYLNYKLGKGVSLKAGLFLMPFGFLNQSHEPPVFSGVERNEVETRIIPSTWREGGIALSGSTKSGFAWDLGLTTGFDVARLDDAGAPLAGSHQELQFAHASSLSYYGALNYRGVPGLTVGGAVFSGDSFHNNADFKADAMQPDFTGIGGRVTLWDVHGRWQGNGLDVQAIYARGTIGEAGKIDTVIRAFNEANGADRPLVPGAFYGWLVQGAYTAWQHGEVSVTPFARYEQFNTQAVMPAGFLADPENADRVLTLGLSFKPVQAVVFKADYQRFLNHTGNDRMNLGLGYMF